MGWEGGVVTRSWGGQGGCCDQVPGRGVVTRSWGEGGVVTRSRGWRGCFDQVLGGEGCCNQVLWGGDGVLCPVPRGGGGYCDQVLWGGVGRGWGVVSSSQGGRRVL